MEFLELIEIELLKSVGYVTIISAVFTIILTSIIKKILVKKDVIYPNMSKAHKDEILSKIARYTALVSYAIVFFLNLFLTKQTIEIDENLIISLTCGGSMTIIVTKGIYTALHQGSKKQLAYTEMERALEIERLVEAEIISLKK